MLTDAALKNLKPKSKAYKSTDRDGLYAYVSPGGAISFRYDYRFNGRRETLTLGRYGRGGLSLAQARERLFEIKRTIADGVSPALEKQRAKRRLKEAHSFEHVAQRWMDTAPMADSTRNMRRSIFNREVLPQWRTRLLSEITPDDLRAHCKSIVDRGAPATAIHVRDIVKQIYGWAILHGEKIDNPADGVGPAFIATFRPRHRSLSPSEIRMVVAFRRHTLLPLDDCLYALQPSIPHLTRSALHRCLQRDGISRLPDIEGDKPKRQRFKRYPIGFFHMEPKVGA